MKLKRLAALSSLYGGSAALTRVAGAAAFFWLARTLSIDDYATFGLLYALQQGLATMAIAGIIEAFVGLMKDERDGTQQYRLLVDANSAFLCMATGSVVAILLLWITFFRHIGSAPLLVGGVMGSGVLLGFSTLQSQLTRLQEKHSSALWFASLPAVAGLALAMGFFAVTPTVSFYFQGLALGTLSSLLFLKMLHAGTWRFSRWSPDIQRILVEATPYVAISLLGWLSGYGNNYVLALLFQRVEIATFTFALTLSSIVQLVASSLNQVWSPRFYVLVRELPIEHVEERNRRFFRLQGLALGLTGGAVIALYPATVDLVGGNLLVYRSITVELTLLFVSYVLLGPWWHCYNYYLVNSEGKELMLVVIASSAIGIVAWISMMWLFGPIGIYVGFLLQMLLRTLILSIAAKRRWPIRPAWEGVAIGIALTVAGFATTLI